MNRLSPFAPFAGCLVASAALLSLSPLLGCSSAADPSPSPSAEEGAAASAEAVSTGDYAYFFADRVRQGYVARPANGALVACGAVLTDACRVASIDLVLALSDADNASVLSALDASAPRSLVFVGQIVTVNGARTLRVVEAWRAPKAVPWSGTLFHVSRSGIDCVKAPCDAANAMRVNLWRKWTAPSIELGFAPPDAHCRFLPETSTGCAKAYDLARAAMALPAGLLVAGYRMSDGTLLVDQYFVRIGVGGTCDDGGLSYCDAYSACNPDNGLCFTQCSPAPSCTHGRGRGVMPYVRPDELLPWISDIEVTAPEYP